jgi:hypothetical protein
MAAKFKKKNVYGGKRWRRLLVKKKKIITEESQREKTAEKGQKMIKEEELKEKKIENNLIRMNNKSMKISDEKDLAWIGNEFQTPSHNCLHSSAFKYHPW